ncbi:MAG: hypothetical protein ACXW6K_20000 [Candidatus Binatia bacterium]
MEEEGKGTPTPVVFNSYQLRLLRPSSESKQAQAQAQKRERTWLGTAATAVFSSELSIASVKNSVKSNQP